MTLSKKIDDIKKEIKYLCNFSEKENKGSSAVISYLDYVYEDTSEE
jgi:hypothetical protein